MGKVYTSKLCIVSACNLRGKCIVLCYNVSNKVALCFISGAA